MRNLGGQVVNPYTPSLKLLFYGRENIFREMLRNEQAIVDSNPPESSVLSPCCGSLSVAKKSFPAVPTADGFDAGQMESWLRQADARLGEANLGGLALLLDEIEELFAKPWHHDLMAFLRRLDDFTLRSRVWIVLAGSDSFDLDLSYELWGVELVYCLPALLLYGWPICNE